MDKYIFKDRKEAGQLLASRLSQYAHQKDVLVLALVRGGVPVGYEIARLLHVPLDIYVVRKLGVPGHEELAMGAIASGSVRVLNYDVIKMCGISEQDVGRISKLEQEKLDYYDDIFRGSRPPVDARDKTIILVDDGIATGSTMRVAIMSLRSQKPAKIVVAVPVAPVDVIEQICILSDDCVCFEKVDFFHAVGYWYEDFGQTSNMEVQNLLHQSIVEQGEAHNPAPTK